MKLLFVLLFLFQIKHFLADYPLQGEYMLGKFKPNWSFLGPLLAHVGVHATFTFTIAMFLVPWYVAVLLGLGDAAIHFTMDRIKAGPKYMGRWKPVTAKEWMESKAVTLPCEVPGLTMGPAADEYWFHKRRLRGNVLFWWALGIDQMVHHLTHYGIIYFIILFH
jgi:hypothetical protein